MGSGADRGAVEKAIPNEDQASASKLCDVRREVLNGVDGFSVAYRVDEALSLGSAARASEARHIVRSRLAKARPAEKQEQNEIVTAWFDLEGEHKMVRAVTDIERQLQALAASPLTPQMTEQALGISTAERLRWTKSGLLPTAGTGQFRKWGKVVEFALYPADRMASLCRDQSILAQWRSLDVEASTQRRAAGARQAVKTRHVNDAHRRQARENLDDMAQSIARLVGTPLAVPVVRLALMATMCSRWAKEYAERDNQRSRQRFYDLKDRALRCLVVQPWAVARFVPAGKVRMEVHLCEEHRDEFRDERRWSGSTVYEWVADHRKSLRRCDACVIRENHDFYALFEVTLSFGNGKAAQVESQFCWHLPYPLARAWMPARDTLPHGPARGADGEFYRFGRPVSDAEMVAWPPARLEREIEPLLALFEQNAATGSRQTVR